MIIFMAIALALIAAWCAMAITRIVRGRRAGAGRAVCARCAYALGGWPTPVCPECGQDVRTVGVRAGGSPMVILLAGLAASMVVVLGAPIVGMIAMSAMPASRASTDMTLEWRYGGGGLEVTYRREVYSEPWRRKQSFSGALELAKVVQPPASMTPAPPRGPGVALRLANDGGLPPRGEIMDAVRAADPSIPTDDLPPLVDDLIGTIDRYAGTGVLMPGAAGVNVGSSSSGFSMSTFSPAPGASTVECVSWQSGRRVSSWSRWYHWVATSAVTAAFAALVLWAAHRSKARGWRAVVDDEWAKVPNSGEARG